MTAQSINNSHVPAILYSNNIFTGASDDLVEVNLICKLVGTNMPHMTDTRGAAKRGKGKELKMES